MLKIKLTVYNSCDVGIYSGLFYEDNTNCAVIQYALKHPILEGDKIVVESMEEVEKYGD